jgi:hypothetical protein
MVSEGEEKSTASGSDTEIDEGKTKGYGTTRHGSHLTKTAEGVAESEDVEGKNTKSLTKKLFYSFRLGQLTN